MRVSADECRAASLPVVFIQMWNCRMYVSSVTWPRKVKRWK